MCLEHILKAIDILLEGKKQYSYEQAVSNPITFFGFVKHVEIFLNPVPPICNPDAFTRVEKENCFLKMPYGTYEAYTTSDYWKGFKDYIELDDEEYESLSVRTLQVGNSAPMAYNLQGKPVNGDYKGIVIRDGRKFLQK